MGGGFMHVNTGSIGQGATDITASMGRIDSLRDELETQVIRPLQTLWQGDASGAWTDIQTQWNQASMAINDLLREIGKHTGTAAEEFLNTEVTNTKMWMA